MALPAVIRSIQVTPSRMSSSQGRGSSAIVEHVDGLRFHVAADQMQLFEGGRDLHVAAEGSGEGELEPG